MAPPWEIPKPRRRLPGGLTGNALISGVVAALVAGAISFTIAHYQSQDAARQAGRPLPGMKSRQSSSLRQTSGHSSK